MTDFNLSSHESYFLFLTRHRFFFIFPTKKNVAYIFLQTTPVFYPEKNCLFFSTDKGCMSFFTRKRLFFISLRITIVTSLQIIAVFYFRPYSYSSFLRRKHLLTRISQTTTVFHFPPETALFIFLSEQQPFLIFPSTSILLFQVRDGCVYYLLDVHKRPII